jgi:MinD-like ATPase involved in chromosome partitioning or flagellar assembly
MQTITFYSYKGGVGRSLILANIANKLSKFGKKVCLLDFDLEAPGLPFKFYEDLVKDIDKGIVDYIYEFVHNGILKPDIKEYLIEKYDSVGDIDNIVLIPAGNPDSSDYWKKLSSINWYHLLYENPDGLSFFLDLKEKIKKQINPDFLLIDSRTGISEMSGISLSLLADELVIVSANNRENLSGVSRIINAFERDSSLMFGRKLKTTFVLSRIPFPEKPEDVAKEQALIEKIKRESLPAGIDEINVIHSDRDLELDEQLKIGDYLDEQSSSSNDYLNLFEKLMKIHISKDDLEKFNNIKRAEEYFIQATTKDLTNVQRIDLINKGLALNPFRLEFIHYRAFYFFLDKKYDLTLKDIESLSVINYRNWRIYSLQGYTFDNLGKMDEALLSHLKAVEESKGNTTALANVASLYSRSKKYDLAIEYYQRSIDADKENFASYNGLANVYRLKGQFPLAFETIYKSLEINPNFAIGFATLAEINAAVGNTQEFYLNLEKCFIAAGSNEIVNVQRSLCKEEIYLKFINEERFNRLLEKYNVAYQHSPE